MSCGNRLERLPDGEALAAERRIIAAVGPDRSRARQQPCTVPSLRLHGTPFTSLGPGVRGAKCIERGCAFVGLADDLGRGRCGVDSTRGRRDAERTSLQSGRSCLSALPRPDLPPGAQRDLVAALHDLHHRAGWPSLRTLGGEAGCSHTTVSTVFSSTKLPNWGLLQLVVGAMGGDVGEFHRLWLLASNGDKASGRAVQLAGRRPELATVRRHLESGVGLCLVTGEAGMGKTALVGAARAATDVFVARGAGLPLRRPCLSSRWRP